MEDKKPSVFKKVFKKYGVLFKKMVIPIILFCSAIAAVVIWTSYVNNHLDRIEDIAHERKNINERLLEQVEKIENMGTPVSPGFIILTKQDMNSIKKILFSLKNELDESIKQSRMEVIGIVDRVNLYVTIGIVLLTLLGVFVPVIVQSFGSQEIRERQRELDEKMESFKTEVSNVTPLRLSHSLLRALNKDLIRWYAKKSKDTEELLKSIFENIRRDLETCKEKNILYSNKIDIKDSLRDFNLHLKDLLFTFQGDRKYLNKFERLKNSIERFTNSGDSESEKDFFDGIINEVKNIIN